jgi:hypothetical protein
MITDQTTYTVYLMDPIGNNDVTDSILTYLGCSFFFGKSLKSPLLFLYMTTCFPYSYYVFNESG